MSDIKDTLVFDEDELDIIYAAILAYQYIVGTTWMIPGEKIVWERTLDKLASQYKERKNDE